MTPTRPTTPTAGDPGLPPEFYRLSLLVLTAENDPAQAVHEVQSQLAVLGDDDSGSPWTASLLFGPDDELGDEGTSVVATGVVTRPVTDPATQARAFDLARTLRQAGSFPEVEPDLPVNAYAPPPRSGFAASGPQLRASADRAWGRNQIFAEEAWALTPPAGGAVKGHGIVIGHPDTGYTNHPSIGNIYDINKDVDFIDDDDDALDPLDQGLPLTVFPGHGTGTSSVMAGRGGHPEDGTFMGVAPEATLVPIRAVRSVIQFLDRDVAKAVEHARNHGCAVISMSLGGKGFFGLKRAIRRAVDDGMIVMAAAGNYVMIVTSPASYDECLAVAGSNADRGTWAGSSRGKAVDITAPGESVWTAGWDLSAGTPHVGQSSGTSHAVAHLAGVAALWLAYHGVANLRARYGGNLQWAFLQLVQQTCTTPPGWDTGSYGPGIVNAKALLEAQLPTLPSGFGGRAPKPPPLEPDRHDRLERIANTFSDLDTGDVASFLRAELSLDDAAFDELLNQDGAELHFRLLNDPDARNALVPPAGFTGGPALADILRETGSVGLAARLGAPG